MTVRDLIICRICHNERLHPKLTFKFVAHEQYSHLNFGDLEISDKVVNK